MIIGSLHVRLLLREARSLKDKRQVVRSILDRLRQGNVAASEVGHLEDCKTLELGIAAIGPDHAGVQHQLQTIQEALRSHPIALYAEGNISVGRDIV